MDKKKILILFADVGNGHRAAAQALVSTFNTKYPDRYDVKMVDLFKETDVEPYNTSQESYELFTRNSTLLRVSNFFFRLFNTSFFYPVFYNYTSGRLLKESQELIQEYDPDMVISVHPIVSMVVKDLKIKGADFKSITVITDLLTIMRGWADETADLIFSPTNDAVSILTRYGADIKKIVYPLFPIDPKFKKTVNREEFQKSLGFNSEKPVVMVTGGGGGTNTQMRAIKYLAKKGHQIMIMCGKRADVLENLTERFAEYPHVKIIGYVTNMQDYMNASDIIICKPGTTSIMEVEVLNKKGIISQPIGEQEKGNIEYALQNPKFRYFGKDSRKLSKILEELLKGGDFNSVQPRRSLDESEQIVEKIVEVLEK